MRANEFWQDALCLLTQHRSVIGTRYYLKGKNNLSNLGQNRSNKMDSRRPDRALAKTKAHNRDRHTEVRKVITNV